MMHRVPALSGPLRGLGRPTWTTTAALHSSSSSSPSETRLTPAPSFRAAAPTLGHTQSRFITRRSTGRTAIETTWKRTPPKPKPDIETYLFSDHVLNLAHEGTPGVREYDAADEQFLGRKWTALGKEDAAARERVDAYVEDVNQARDVYKTLQADASLTHWRIREFDLLSLALRGGLASTTQPAESTSSPSSPHEGEVRPATASLLRRNGIPRVVWDDDTTLLWWMAAKQERGPPKLPVLSGLGRSNGAEDSQVLEYEDIRRLVHVVLSTGKGTQALESLQSRIYASWFQGPDRPAELRTDYEVLAFIGDLNRALEMGGSSLDRRLSLVALEHAAQGLFSHEIATYLNSLTDGLSDQEMASTSFAAAIRKALQALSRGLATLEHPGLGNSVPPGAFPSRRQFFKILTGHGSGSPKIRHPFSGAMAQRAVRQAAYPTYIHILARLGALRILWNEWRVFTRLEGKDGADHSGLQKAEIFTRALVDAHDTVFQYHLENSPQTKLIRDASRRDHESMPLFIEPARRPAPHYGAAAPELPPGLSSRVMEAFEDKSTYTSLAKIQQLIGEAVLEDEGRAIQEEEE